VKKFAVMSFLLVFILLSANVLASVQNYYEDILLDETGKSLVKLSLTVTKPITDLKFIVVGKIENIQAASSKGSMNCSLMIEGVSYVDCVFLLPQEMEEFTSVYVNFTTSDFVKVLDTKRRFTADLSLNQSIESAFIFIRLPEGMVVEEEDKKLISPENSTMITDGRRIIVMWQLNDIEAGEYLTSQVMYEGIVPTPLVQIRLRYILIFGVAAGGVIGFIYIRHFRKPQKLILSVLDDYERKVMNLIIASEGVVDQKKIVKDTNLSKAKVSRVVKSLVERGLIEIERIGRRNKLKLIKKKFTI